MQSFGSIMILIETLTLCHCYFVIMFLHWCLSPSYQPLQLLKKHGEVCLLKARISHTYQIKANTSPVTTFWLLWAILANISGGFKMVFLRDRDREILCVNTSDSPLPNAGEHAGCRLLHVRSGSATVSLNSAMESRVRFISA